MTSRRRLIPYATVGVLALLTFGAALVGVLGSPSPQQISLQNAAERTAEAPSFSYTLDNQLEPLKPGQHSVSVLVRGVWQAPDQWRDRNNLDGASSVTTVTGSILHVSDDHGPSMMFQLPSSATESLTDPNSPVLSLPPIGLLFAATSVTRNGDLYSFVVPRLNVGVSGWVAYAPLSDATLPLALTVALNTRADVIVKNGYVVSLVFPNGIRPLRGEALRVADWHISNIGTAALGGMANQSDR
jgi:hypothetical protein